MHYKIKELKRRAMPVNHSDMSVNAAGRLTIEERTIKGYLIVWGVPDCYGTAFIKGSCAKSIQERGPQSSSKCKIAFLWQHHQDDPIGQFTMLKEDDYGLYFEAVCDEGVCSADRAITQVKSGTLNQFSAGFNYIWDKMEYDESTDVILLKEIDLMEGSVVTIAANQETYALRSPEDLEGERELLQEETEDFIRSVPRRQQLELRQLITRHISLYSVKPAMPEGQKSLENEEPIAAGLDYEYLNKNLKLFQND